MKKNILFSLLCAFFLTNISFDAHAMKRKREEESEQDSNISTESKRKKPEETLKATTSIRCIPIKLNKKQLENMFTNLSKFKNLEEVYTAYNVNKDNNPITLLGEQLDEILNICAQADLSKTYPRISQEQLSNAITQFRNAATTRTNAIALTNLEKYSFHEEDGSDDEFSIANELGTFEEALDEIEIKNEESTQQLDRIELSEKTAPLLFKLINKLAKEYKINTPRLFLAKRNKTSYDMRGNDALSRDIKNNFISPVEATKLQSKITIGFYSFKELTNDEIEFAMAHELAHIFAFNTRNIKIINLAFSASPENLLTGEKLSPSSVNKIEEHMADAQALEKTKKPQAAISFFLKSTKQSTVDQENDQEHPSIHERIAFALSQLK